jgi:peptidoglycan/LPS O-acetylase OafA/YrhL
MSSCEEMIALSPLPTSAATNRDGPADKRNNMDLLRLLFACTVMVYHGIVLSQWRSPPLSLFADLAAVGVDGFFVISGYLIFQSYEKSQSLKDYVQKRIRRIYPAYATVIAAIILIGAIVTELPLSDYIGTRLAHYALANLAFLNFLVPALPGVFLHNPVTAADGSLWTIKVEVMFYVSVPIIVWACKRAPRSVLFCLIYVLSALYRLFFSHLFVTTGHEIYDTLAKQLPGQMTFFISGAALYYYRHAVKKYSQLVIPAAVVLVALDFWGWPLQPIFPAALSIVVIAVAFGPYMGNAGYFGDISYGVYIWHFPIIQTFVASGLFASQPRAAFATSLGITLALAFLSWHLVEKRFLKRSSHYREAEWTTQTVAPPNGGDGGGALLPP